MKAATRLLASVAKGGAQYLEPGAPTGLTGLLTHAAPRTALLYTYNTTLDKLAQFPESSVYRQSTEALTRHRLAIIEKTRPAGLAEWQSRVQDTLKEHPQAFKKVPLSTSSKKSEGGEYNIIWAPTTTQSVQADEWDYEHKGKPMLEGVRSEAVQAKQLKEMARDPIEEYRVVPRIEPEPSLTAEQIGQLETEIGAGLIEEVIQVAEGERGLVEVLAKAQV